MTVDVVSNGRIDSGGSERPGRYVVAVGKQGKDRSRLGRSTEGVSDDGGAMQALQFLQKFYKTQPLLKCYRDLWLKERHEIWKVTTGATSFGVGNSHSMVDKERLTPVVLQAVDRGGWQESTGDGP
ncbi:hypothetical protein BHM03_00012731 [Ensete ventricosum]|nr:hypothetical protein BHM03_00012731 [Ensete ventricosum]